jgi:hypothetical protein
MAFAQHSTMLLQLLLFYSSGLLLFNVAVDGSRVELVNNGYRDIVIAISPDAPQDLNLLDNIKVFNSPSN